jgi:hypothetical protein
MLNPTFGICWVDPGIARVQDILRKGERVKNQAQTRKGGTKQKGTVWASKYRHEI